MIVAFANNQTMSAVGGGSTNDLYTDPVPMGENDRASPIFNVHYAFAGGGGGTPTISYQGQMSNDGTNWVDVTGLTDSTTAATATPRALAAKSVNGAFIRFKFSFGSTGTGTAGVAFDLHVLLDHQ